MAIAAILTALAGYLLGSINFGIIVCKILFGKDPRTMGSGGAGMTNVIRSFGKKAAVPTLLGDVLKAMVSVWLGHLFTALFAPGLDPLYCAYIGGIFAIIGHSFPLYFHFKGGKGVACAGGAILVIQPVLAIILLSIFLVIFAIAKMVSLASIIGISLYPVVTLLWALLYSHRAPVYSTVCAAIIAAMVVWMHRANIQRIRNGTEYKFSQKKKQGTE